MSINLISEKLCTGCGACFDVCPVKAISRSENKEGFWYYTADENKCVKCGLCEKKCPVNTDKRGTLGSVLDSNAELQAVFIQSKNDTFRFNSSSGGVFPMLAKQFIEQGGVVFGAGFDLDWRVCHFGIDKCEDIEKLQSSKYAQSDMTGVYTKVKQLLLEGKRVMFTGTPCQVSALNNIIDEKLKDNLFLVDLFCHGISSPGLFKNYLSQIIQSDDISFISFRHKKNGWEKYNMHIVYDNGKTYSKHYRKDPYLSAFCSSVSLRNSCYNCKSKGFPRCSDLTLGDFWMIDRIFPELNDHKGASFVLINSQKGVVQINVIKDQALITPIERKYLTSIYCNSGNPVSTPPVRDAFFDMANNKGIKLASKKYGQKPLKDRVANDIRKVLIKLGVYEMLRRIKHRR